MSTMLAFGFTSAMADDIDLFVGAPPAGAAAPNVLIVIDNTANWNNAFTNEMAALEDVVSNLPEDKIRLGLMMFTETGGGNSGNAGAYVRAAMRLMDDTNQKKYVDLVASIDKNADKSNGGKLGKAMEEAYLYFSAGVPHAGNNKDKTDYLGNTSGTSESRSVYGLTDNALTSKSGTSYKNPILDGCAKNFVIYISNGAAQDNNSDISQATAALNAAALAEFGASGFGLTSTTTIPISPSGSQSNVADEWARFMKRSSLNISTYMVDVDKVTTGQGPGWTALLKSAATVSSGKYFDVSSSGSEILDALNSIFAEIQAVNSVFASVSLPVSVNTQGTFLNQVFIGMFRPDEASLPRWQGNLKQYKLGFAGSPATLQLLDADDTAAISPSTQTGFIEGCARSFWTPTTADSYWSFKPQGLCTIANSDASNSPDGNIVEKGAQAYQLRSTTNRNLKTCSSASCTTLTNFDASNSAITAALLGAASTAERNELINWQRGLDLDDENVNGTTSTEMRPSAHGDVVHSRPVAVNHGTDANPEVVVYYGANDGILRAVNGNRTASIGSVAVGSELWSFMAPEFYSKIKRIKDNTTTITYPGTIATSPAPLSKDYGVDGAVSAYKDASNTWVYASMRRGGRALYAFDVTTPTSPSLKWKLGCPNASDDVGCSTGFTEIGQTWSAPKLLKSEGYNTGTSPMLIIGGGYDTCHDDDPNSACATSKGRKIYLIDANTGSLLQAFNTDGSVTADILVVADQATGLAKYAYTADLSGNVYRISGSTANLEIGTTAPGSWTITKVASLGGSGSDNRKFMFAPDAVDNNGTYTLLLGSGDREKPLNVSDYANANAVKNRFYVIQDKPSDSTWLTSENATCGANIICNDSLLAIGLTDPSPSPAALAVKKGWYLALGSTEKVVTSAITVFDTVTFSTHTPTPPASGACTTLGTATVYNLNYTNGDSVGNTVRGAAVIGGGLSPSPVAGMVTLDSGETVPFIIGANPTSALQGGNPPSASQAIRPKGRVFWNIEK